MIINDLAYVIGIKFWKVKEKVYFCTELYKGCVTIVKGDASTILEITEQTQQKLKVQPSGLVYRHSKD